MTQKFSELLNVNKFLVISLVSSLLLSSSALGVQRTALSIYSQLFDGAFSSFTIFSAAISLSVFGMSKAFGNISGGKLSDVLGRSYSGKIGLLIIAVGSIFLFRAKSIFVFFLANSVVGLGIGILFASAAVAFTDLGGPFHRAKAISLMELSVYFGTSIGAVMAGQVASSEDFRTPFIVAAVIVIIANLFGLTIRDTRSFVSSEEKIGYQTAKEKFDTIKDELGGEEVHVEFSELLEDHIEVSRGAGETTLEQDLSILFTVNFLISTLTGVVSRIADTAMILIFPLLVLEYGFSPLQLGLAASLFTFMWAIGITITGLISDKLGRKIPMVVGLYTEALGLTLMFAFGFQQWYPMILFGVLVAGFARGLYFPIPASITADIAEPAERGAMLGLYRFFLDMGYLIGSLLMVLLIETRSTSSSLRSTFEGAFFIVVVIIILQGTVISLFFKDSRPGFKQFEDARMHLEMISESIHSTSTCIGMINDSKYDNAQSELVQAKLAERKADAILENMTKQTYSGVFKAPDASEMLQFSIKIDKAAGYVIRATRKLLMVKDKVPEDILQKMAYYSKILNILIETTVETFELINVRMNLAIEQSYQVNYVEELLDDLHKLLWQELTLHSEELEPLTILLLSEVIDSTEKAANIFEDAAELIRLISFKH